MPQGELHAGYRIIETLEKKVLFVFYALAQHW